MAVKADRYGSYTTVCKEISKYLQEGTHIVHDTSPAHIDHSDEHSHNLRCPGAQKEDSQL